MPTKRYSEFMDPKLVLDKKASKPLMEKRRRARINHSLAQLKSLIIDPNTTERSRQSKLEKADILELTVRHLHEIKRRQRTASLLDSRNPKKKFEVGYSECAREVDLFLSTLINPQTSLDSELHRRLKEHLNRRLLDLKNIDPIEENVKIKDSDDVVISSSTHSKNLDHLCPPVEGYNPSQPENAHNYKHNCERECDTTAINFDSSTSENVSLNYMDQNIAHAHVSSSSSIETNMTLDDSEGFPSISSPEKQDKNFEFCESLTVNTQVFAQSEFQSKTINRNFGEVLTTPSNVHWQSQNFKQVPLVPKHLSNGEWALVLPQNISLSENEVHSFSAFRLVLPSSSSDSDHDRHGIGQHYSPSPVSNSLSDISSEEYSSRTDREPSDNLEYRENNEYNFTSQFVWRPW